MNRSQQINTIAEFTSLYADIELVIEKSGIESNQVSKILTSCISEEQISFTMYINIIDMECIRVELVDAILNVRELTFNGKDATVDSIKRRLNDLKDMLTTLKELK